jgi:hypothetical protein
MGFFVNHAFIYLLKGLKKICHVAAILQHFAPIFAIIYQNAVSAAGQGIIISSAICLSIGLICCIVRLLHLAGTIFKIFTLCILFAPRRSFKLARPPIYLMVTNYLEGKGRF